MSKFPSPLKSPAVRSSAPSEQATPSQPGGPSCTLTNGSNDSAGSTPDWTAIANVSSSKPTAYATPLPPKRFVLIRRPSHAGDGWWSGPGVDCPACGRTARGARGAPCIHHRDCVDLCRRSRTLSSRTRPSTAWAHSVTRVGDCCVDVSGTREAGLVKRVTPTDRIGGGGTLHE